MAKVTDIATDTALRVPRWRYELFRRWFLGDPKADPDPTVGRATRPPGG